MKKIAYLIELVSENDWLRRKKPVKIRKVDMSSIEEDGVVFFNTIKLKDYPEFLEDSLNKINRSYTDTSGIVFGPWEGSKWDESDPPIPDGYIVLGAFTGETQISIYDFYILCLQFAEKSLEAVGVFRLKEQGLVDDDWINRIQKTIPQFEKIISKC